MGVKKGDRVAILAELCYQYAEVALGVPKGGMVLVPLNYRFVPEEIAHTINDAGAETLIIGEGFTNVLDSMRPYLNNVRNIIVTGEPSQGTKSYDDLISSYSSTPLEVEIDEKDLAYIIYTSGTTAHPKGVMRTHKSMMATAMATAYHHHVMHNDVCLVMLAPFHIGFMWPLLTFVFLGCTTVLQRWNTEEALKLIDREKVTFCLLGPYSIRAMLDYPELKKYDISSIRRIGVGSAPAGMDLMKRVMSVWGNVINLQYGMTEYGTPVTVLPAEEIDIESPRGAQLLSSVGRPVFNAQVRIVDENGNDVLPGEAGEVIVKGDALMSGYWNMPEETAATMRGGYFYTGDVAKVDEEGNLYIVDRKKDMIISGGENVYCPEVESLLRTHPAVSEAAIIGIPDAKWGEAVKGLVTLKPGATVTEDELKEFCRSQLAGYKIPKSIDFYEDLPRTSMGKIYKKELREKYWAGHEKKSH